MIDLIFSALVQLACIAAITGGILFILFLIVAAFCVGLGKTKIKLPDWVFWWSAAGNND